jgi:hypothetical protein
MKLQVNAPTAVEVAPLPVPEGLVQFKKACVRDALTFREFNPCSETPDKMHVERHMILQPFGARTMTGYLIHRNGLAHQAG